MAKSGNSTTVPLRSRRRSDRHKITLLFGSGFIGLLVMVSVIWWGVNTVKDTLLSRMVTVESALQGSLEVTAPVQAVLARDEQIVTARRTGKVKVVIPEGERVRKGALLAYVTSQTIEKGSGELTVPVYSPATGVVSYQIDNLETFISPENIEELGVEKILARVEAAPAEQPIGAADGLVQAGQAICKIVNNLKPTYFVIDAAKTGIKPEDYKKGNLLYGKLKLTDKESTSFRVQGGAKPSFLVLSSGASFPEFIQKRKLTLTMVINHYQGYIIPKAAVATKNGQQGIFIVYKEVASWQPVVVKGEAEGKAAVLPLDSSDPGMLTPNALVVKNPELAEEGQVVSVR